MDHPVFTGQRNALAQAAPCPPAEKGRASVGHHRPKRDGAHTAAPRKNGDWSVFCRPRPDLSSRCSNASTAPAAASGESGFMLDPPIRGFLSPI